MPEQPEDKYDKHDELDAARTIPSSDEPDAATLSAGSTLGGFRLEAPIGRGGMGEVWKAYDVKGERPVVLKLVPPELQHAEEEMARVKATFRRIHALQHQHICPVYMLDEDDRFGWFVVMKYIEGQTLSSYRATYEARRGSFPVEQVVRVLTPVADALDYAHAQKVVHRDVKPQNIMVVGDAEDVQVVDFGLAAEIRSTVSRISQVRMDTSGTRPYMAPEQWRGDYQDARTDQFALAVVAYELLAGRLPFDSSDFDILRACVLNDPPPQLQDQHEDVNRALIRGMSKDRSERFENCRELIDALQVVRRKCPACGKSLVVPQRCAERTLKCPACGEHLQVASDRGLSIAEPAAPEIVPPTQPVSTGAKSTTPTQPPRTAERVELPGPLAAASPEDGSGTMKCPRCKGVINLGAKLCCHCHSSLSPEEVKAAVAEAGRAKLRGKMKRRKVCGWILICFSGFMLCAMFCAAISAPFSEDPLSWDVIFVNLVFYALMLCGGIVLLGRAKRIKEELGEHEYEKYQQKWSQRR